MDAEWFYLEDGQQKGPVSRADLLPLLRMLPRGTLVWRDGLGDWRAAEELDELAEKLAAPPAPAPPPPPLPVPTPLRPSSVQGGEAAGTGGGVPASTGVARSASSPRTTPAATARPAYRPTTTPAARRSGAPGAAAPADPETLNPFVLWRRSFSFGGRFNRVEFAIAHFGILFFCFAALLGIGAVGMVTGREPSEGGQMFLGFAAIVMFPILLIILLGSCVRRLRDLGQSGWLALVLLLPCFSLLLLVYLLAAPSSADATAARGDSRAPVSGPSGVSWVIIAVVAVFGGIMLIGMVAAIAIPSLLRARIAANESGTLGDIRSVISGQAAYQAMNGGFYEGRLECLAAPAQCIANSTAPGVVPAETTAATRMGYSRELLTSSLAADLPPGISPSSVTSFAIVAYPLKPLQSGVRSFCGDHTGRVCFDPEGGRSLVEQTETEVACAATCQDVR